MVPMARPSLSDGDPHVSGSSFKRGSRLLSLPLGAAGRATKGLGRRLAGSSAETINQQLRAETAEQLFRVLGELKGGAMKFGQALSLFEVMLPDDISGPYRAQLKKLQDSAPPMPAARVHAVLARELGPHWRSLFAEFSNRPAAAASIGQVHRAVWAETGEQVAVKVQYPGADKALESDLKQLSRVTGLIAPLSGGMEVKPLIEEIVERILEETDYDLESASQQQAAEGFRGHPEFCVPRVLTHTQRVMVSEWIDGMALSGVADLPEGQRNEFGLRYVEFLFAGPSEVGLLHADPHPGNFKIMPDGRLGVVDFGLVSRLPDGLPAAMGRLLSIAVSGDAHRVTEGLKAEGFIAGNAADIDPQELLDYLSPFLEPAEVDEFHFTRDWMQREFKRVGTTRVNGTVLEQLNLPPSYALIHRVWLGAIAVLSQLDVRANFRGILDRYLPEWNAR